MSIQPCLMSHDDEQHETLTAPTSKHIVVNGHCEPGAQTRVWLSPTCCWIYLLGHWHDCDCHQHALYFEGMHSAANAFKDPHCQEKLSSFQQSSPLSSLILAERRVLRGAGLLVCTSAMDGMSMSGFRKQRCNICLTIGEKRS